MGIVMSKIGADDQVTTKRLAEGKAHEAIVPWHYGFA
jgi:hypothetical protein